MASCPIDTHKPSRITRACEETRLASASAAFWDLYEMAKSNTELTSTITMMSAPLTVAPVKSAIPAATMSTH